MSTEFEPGLYLARIEKQYFTEHYEKGTLGFCLEFLIVKNLNAPNASVQEYLRWIIVWITENNIERVLHDLRELGYKGDRLAGIDPDTELFYDFRGQEIEVTCAHEKTEKRGTLERWSLPSTNLRIKSKLRRFDLLLAKNQDYTNGAAGNFSQVNTDDDLWF